MFYGESLLADYGTDFLLPQNGSSSAEAVYPTEIPFVADILSD